MKQTENGIVISKTLMVMFILMNFVLAMSSSIFNGILDQVATEFGFTISETGYLNSFYLYGAGIGVPIFLILFRKYDRITLLKVMLALNIAGTTVLLLVRQFIPMVSIRFLMGLAGNCYSVLATATIAALTPKEKLGSALSILIAGSAAANIIGVPMVRAFSHVLSWQQNYMILIAIMVVSLLYFLLKLPALHEERTGFNLKEEFAWLKNKQVLIALAASLVTFFGYGLQTYLTPYVIELFPEMEQHMSFILVLIGIFSFVGNQLGGVLCTKYGYYKSMIFGTALQAVTALLMLFTQHMAYANIILILIWMMNAWLIGLEINTSINIVTDRKSSFMVSLNSSGIQLGTAIGTSIAAGIISSFGIRFIPITSFVTAVLIILMMAANLKNAPK